MTEFLTFFVSRDNFNTNLDIEHLFINYDQYEKYSTH